MTNPSKDARTIEEFREGSFMEITVQHLATGIKVTRSGTICSELPTTKKLRAFLLRSCENKLIRQLKKVNNHGQSNYC